MLTKVKIHCEDKEHWWLSDDVGDFCGGCGGDRGIIETGDHPLEESSSAEELDKAGLLMPTKTPKREHHISAVGLVVGGNFPCFPLRFNINSTSYLIGT